MSKYLNANFAKGFGATTLFLFTTRPLYFFKGSLGAPVQPSPLYVIENTPVGPVPFFNPLDKYPEPIPWSFITPEQVTKTQYPWYLVSAVIGLGYSYYKG